MELLEHILKPICEWIQQENYCEENQVITLWRPLKFTLARINGYPKLNKIANVDDVTTFLKEFTKQDIESFLPVQKSVVVKLAKLFELGMTSANMMEFPNDSDGGSLAQVRLQAPYYDYMPYFLHECFQGGMLATCFENDQELIAWIKEQHLEMFFEKDEIQKEKVKDLTGMNDYRKTIPLDLEVLLDNYIEILTKRAYNR